MRNYKQTSNFIFNTVLASMLLFIVSACQPGPDNKDPLGPERYRAHLLEGKLKPMQVRGGKYPPAKFDLKRPLNEGEEDKPYYVPNGPLRGKLAPQNREFTPKQIKKPGAGGGSQAPLYYEDYEELDDATPTAHSLVPEPSVAENGQTIMTVGNFWMSLSEDGGNTFTTVNPTTIFPEDYGGFCCDQVLTYVPKYDLFVWLLQYWQKDGKNAIRIAVATTKEVRDSNATAWTYWDFTNDVFAASGTLDYNDMSFGDTNLYWTSSVGGGSNRYVIRVPLSEMKAKGTVHFQYTGSTAAYWSHVSQNGHNGVYWAGHVDNSTLKVYSMMDGDGFYSWREVPINSWPNGTMSSITADGKDWLADASWKTYVRAATVAGNSVYFAWNAAKNDHFPHPHVQIVKISTITFTLEQQMQIWNPEFAFAYPYFYTNNESQVGMIVGFGGGPYNASSGVGVWGDFVIYYPQLSGSSRTNYGHYHTVRKASEPMKWVGAGYYRLADGSIVPYYVKFTH
jgi:hypothetical protein